MESLVLDQRYSKRERGKTTLSYPLLVFPREYENING